MMSIKLFLGLGILAIIGYAFQKYVAKIFVMYVYDLIPENLLPEKLNKLRKKGVEIASTLFFITIGISPVSNLVNGKMPMMQINPMLFQFLLYWMLSITIASYTLAIFFHYTKMLKK